MASLFNNFIEVEETSSTNELAEKLLVKKEIQEGAVITTKFQSDGKGQYGSSWESMYGKNILMSIVLSPNLLLTNRFHLTICISIALLDFSRQYFHNREKVKWPNDLMIDNKKIAGILIKNFIRNGIINNAVIGIGINVNQTLHTRYSLQATSFKLLLGKDFKISVLIDKLLYCIEKRYIEMKTKGIEGMRKKYLDNLLYFNEWREYLISGKKVKAKIINIDNTGNIVMNLDDNKIVKFSLKEITFL
tara:strand:- start:672 stop:1412 length:741 start_codon:yes stop_codon:yes gene_type:complete